MNRKHNPLVALAALVILATILVLICTGCTAEAAETEKTPYRFTVQDAGNRCHIITDTETGVQYLYFWYGSCGGGLTVLQPGEE